MKKPKKVSKVRFIVARLDHMFAVDAVAVVDALVKPVLYDKNAFMVALKTALTEWYKTPKGELAWNASSEDFNIGDLCVELSDPEQELMEELVKNGIFEITIRTFESDSRGTWVFDEVLRNEEG